MGIIKKFFMGSNDEDQKKIEEKLSLVKQKANKKNKRLEELKKELGIQ